MSKLNSTRKGCKDVFNAFLVTAASYEGEFEIPIIRGIRDVPNRLVPFSKAISSKNTNQWVHFYEDDYLFERIWRNPKRYLNILNKYNGIISPDFSLYRDMPLSMQIWNIYRSRAIGHWLQTNGLKVIPNVRFGDERTYNICCEGIEKHSIISIGSHGNLKFVRDREIFLNGLDNVIITLKPSTIIVYGAAPKKYFKKYENMGIKFVKFESEFSISHKEVV